MECPSGTLLENRYVELLSKQHLKYSSTFNHTLTITWREVDLTSLQVSIVFNLLLLMFKFILCLISFRPLFSLSPLSCTSSLPVEHIAIDKFPRALGGTLFLISRAPHRLSQGIWLHHPPSRSTSSRRLIRALDADIAFVVCSDGCAFHVSRETDSRHSRYPQNPLVRIAIPSHGFQMVKAHVVLETDVRLKRDEPGRGAIAIKDPASSSLGRSELKPRRGSQLQEAWSRAAVTESSRSS
ncbi:hypothetical protein VNO77_19826 [Canavalia gladiata]|uniref:Uncharacterized protein n=1 Tax=Canavalia gladiata TaxID=3824 RepID=A0AAN9LRM5_CANGL